ncbi:hypothetical protein SLNSH_20575 [Alsobacter soli]|uniref:Glycoside hydrolase family 5 domain-containing protein n=1 Tax=Alsobacter soli TaxID=2109933 RepID=A0A2T1HNB4_9HYPH|nr:glycoside hydrolase family 5 protein [Alsobacter soli]PSC03128.1 hypothetical protein SLNSH_20575 [Alsobacter soli]
MSRLIARRPLLGALAVGGLALTRRTASSGPSQKTPFLRGVNLSGKEFYPGDQWPRKEVVRYYLREKRMNCARLCISWELLQPQLGGPLASDMVDGIERMIEQISAAQAWTILDLHNYSRRTEAGITYIIGESGTRVTIGHLAGLWKAIAERWGNRKDVLFGLMNEPHDQSTAILVKSYNETIAAIRATGSSNLILVNGNDWNAEAWRPGHDNLDLMLNVSDPADNLAFDVHQYFDRYSAGQKPEVVKGWGEGLRNFTTWARKHGKKGFCGEFAGPGSADGVAAVDAFLTYLEMNQDVWLGWAWWGAGGWWPRDYLFRLDPISLNEPWPDPPIDQPGMAALTHRLPGATPFNGQQAQ